MTRPELIGGLLAVGIAALVLELVRRRKLSEEYSLLWAVATVGAAVIAVWGKLIAWISRAIGALHETSTVFFFGILFVLVVLLYYAVKLTALTLEVRRLAQEAALLRFRLDEDASLESRAKGEES